MKASILATLATAIGSAAAGTVNGLNWPPGDDQWTLAPGPDLYYADGSNPVLPETSRALVCRQYDIDIFTGAIYDVPLPAAGVKDQFPLLRKLRTLGSRYNSP